MWPTVLTDLDKLFLICAVLVLVGLHLCLVVAVQFRELSRALTAQDEAERTSQNDKRRNEKLGWHLIDLWKEKRKHEAIAQDALQRLDELPLQQRFGSGRHRLEQVH